ncbi:uncharacterized protein BJ212DRAFT_1304720 [Suillus subaureus]|uniref:Uncharacterized protein n=1 Tax=Suillus subaureus TaxID=48587 RepID=A0A9P7J539_9AGAM|nr:uncharacterized protein BJ212DRAFT_1304720 [Suillus subaureus]KAG1803061.1 hypothetical protein BJ212DRAFT_1304720 [Suillus subaureus]
MAVTYGYVTHGHEDPLLTKACELFHIGKQIVSPEKAAIFTAFPFFKKLPFWCFSGAFSLMRHSRELAQQLLNEAFDKVKAQICLISWHGHYYNCIVDIPAGYGALSWHPSLCSCGN